MVLLKPVPQVSHGEDCLQLLDLPEPVPKAGEILIKVNACAICHTELDEIEGRLLPRQLPRVLGHQVVGQVDSLGQGVGGFQPGERVGVGWIASSCGECRYCRSGRENLCSDFRGTGYDIDGGYAEKMVVDAAFAFPLPPHLDDTHTAPLLCAGAIGRRALKLCGLCNGDSLGLMGFGASGHLVLQMAKYCYPRSPVVVFARSEAARDFARSLGADWAGSPDLQPPLPLTAMIDTTPAWHPVVAALEYLAPGGRLIINAIRKESSDQVALQNLDYASHMWLEKEVKTVANITRKDIQAFLVLAEKMVLQADFQTFALSEANETLWELKTHSVPGAKVLLP